MYDVICAKCLKEFEVDFLEDIVCPNCKNNNFYWDSYFCYDEDGNIEDECFFIIQEEYYV